MSNTANSDPAFSEREIEDLLALDLHQRNARGESAESALESNYQLGLRLRQAVSDPPDEDESDMSRAALWVDLQEVKFATRMQGGIILILAAAVIYLLFR